MNEQLIGNSIYFITIFQIVKLLPSCEKNKFGFSVGYINVSWLSPHEHLHNRGKVNFSIIPEFINYFR